MSNWEELNKKLLADISKLDLDQPPKSIPFTSPATDIEEMYAVYGASFTLSIGFLWYETAEGYEYWDNICVKLNEAEKEGLLK